MASVKDGPSEDVLRIDEFALEKEWTDQPRLYFRWAKEAADARARVDAAKSALELTKAEVDSEIRANPEDYGIEGKITERAVEARIVESSAYVAAAKKLAEAKHYYDVVSALVSALEQRKSALENLVRLFLASYYAEPKAPREHREAVDEMVKRQVRRRGK